MKGPERAAAGLCHDWQSSGRMAHQGAEEVKCFRHALNHRVAAPDHAIAVENEAVDLVDQSTLVLEGCTAGCKGDGKGRQSGGERSKSTMRQAQSGIPR